MTRVGTDAKPSAVTGPQLLNSKSVPALHHIGELKWVCLGLNLHSFANWWSLEFNLLSKLHLARFWNGFWMLFNRFSESFRIRFDDHMRPSQCNQSWMHSMNEIASEFGFNVLNYLSGNAGNKSRSVHNLTGPSNSAGNINAVPDQGFYQNLSVYRQQNQSQPNLGDK